MQRLEVMPHRLPDLLLLRGVLHLGDGLPFAVVEGELGDVVAAPAIILIAKPWVVAIELDQIAGSLAKQVQRLRENVEFLQRSYLELVLLCQDLEDYKKKLDQTVMDNDRIPEVHGRGDDQDSANKKEAIKAIVKQMEAASVILKFIDHLEKPIKKRSKSEMQQQNHKNFAIRIEKLDNDLDAEEILQWIRNQHRKSESTSSKPSQSKVDEEWQRAS